MPITKLPDLGAAIMLYLQESTALAAYTTKIFLEWPQNDQKIIVPPFVNCVLINTGMGGPGAAGLGLQDERVDIRCYGKNMKTAHDMWKTIEWYFEPGDVRRATSFQRADCSVLVISREGGPLRLRDDGLAGWPFVTAPYRFLYSGTPTS